MHCILMDFPTQINTISWDCPLYIYGVTGRNFQIMYFSLWRSFLLQENSAHSVAFQLGLQCFSSSHIEV